MLSQSFRSSYPPATAHCQPSPTPQILQQQPNLYSKRVHRFSDEKDVEVVARVGRVWDEDGNVDHQALDLAEVILRAGIQQFPK